MGIPVPTAALTISRFVERFRDGQYSLAVFLFAVHLLTVPPCSQPFVELGARAPFPSPMEFMPVALHTGPG